MFRRRPPRPTSSAEVVPLSRTQLLGVLAGLLLVGGVLLYGLGYTLVSSFSAGTAPDGVLNDAHQDADPAQRRDLIAAAPMATVAEDVAASGYQLKVYDCYRPQRAVDDFVVWAKDPDDDVTRAEFYPRLAKDVLFPQGYILAKSGHTRGSTVDLTLVAQGAGVSPQWVVGDPLVDCTAPVGQRFADTSVDMGTGFDCFDPLSATASTKVTAQQRANRDVLLEAMTAAGFTNLAEEWWHYTLADEPFPDTYFDVPIQ